MSKIYEMSAGKVTLHNDAMLNVLASAVRNARDAMSRAQGEVDSVIYRKDESEYHKNHHMAFYAEVLAKHAKEYADAMQAYHAYYEHISGRTLDTK